LGRAALASKRSSARHLTYVEDGVVLETAGKEQVWLFVLSQRRGSSPAPRQRRRHGREPGNWVVVELGHHLAGRVGEEEQHHYLG
jgi:hypothetical protein